MKEIGVIAIGYAKQAFREGSRERIRMERYAAHFAEYHIIVFTKKAEGFPSVQQSGTLFLHATNAHTKVEMLWRAYRIGRTILQQSNRRFVVTCQDPFETALVGGAVAFGNRATDHIQIHGDVFNPQSYQHSLLQRLRMVYGKYVVRRAKNIRVVSERIKTGLLSLGVLPRAITVLPIYADLKQFLAVGAVRNYRVSDTVRFLYVGRFAAEKNIPLLLAAFAVVTKKYPSAQLTLLGAGPEEAGFKALVEEYQITTRVTFLPWTDNVPMVMKNHDVFCLASNHEGWGMVLLEAAATGMPIITTDVGCAGTCVVHNENGYIVPVEHQSEFEAAMEQYCSTPRLVSTHGAASYHLAKQQALSETEYELKVVDSLTSCVP